MKRLARFAWILTKSLLTLAAFPLTALAIVAFLEWTQDTKLGKICLGFAAIVIFVITFIGTLFIIRDAIKNAWHESGTVDADNC